MGFGAAFRGFTHQPLARGILGLLLLGFLGVADAAKSKKLDDAWTERGYTFADTSDQMKNSACYSSEKNFFACVKGVDAILGFAPSPLRLFPIAYQKRHTLTVDSHGELGSACMAPPVQATPKTQAESIRIMRETRDELRKDWSQVFASATATAPPVDFENITALLQKEPYFAKKEPILFGAVANALFSVLYDPHTELYPYADTKEFFDATSDPGFVGIGAALKQTSHNGKQYPIISSVIEESPAQKVGLKADDVIVKVDGSDVGDKKLEDVISLVRGPSFTEVNLDIERGTTLMTFKLKRAPIVTPTVRYRAVGEQKDVGYIRLFNFTDMDDQGQALPCAKVREAIQKLSAETVSSFILDLRENGGGLLTEAECVSNLFLKLEPGEPIVISKSLKSDLPSYMLPRNYPAAPETQLPLVLLIDAGSASASEIVAGALQDYLRAYLVGERSFGKGTIQNFDKLGYQQPLLLKQTIARFLQPSGRTNQIVSILPDVTRYFVPNPTDDDKVAFREEDYYSAIAPDGPQWKQPRPKQVAQLESCMQTTGKADALYQATPDGTDYQFESAIDAAHCVVAEKLWKPEDQPVFGKPNWLRQEELQRSQSRQIVQRPF